MRLHKIYDDLRKANCYINKKDIIAITPVPPEVEKEFNSVICLSGNVQVYLLDQIDSVLEKLSKLDSTHLPDKLVTIQDDLRDLNVIINTSEIIAIVPDPNEDKNFKSIICLKEEAQVCSKLNFEEVISVLDETYYTEYTD